MSKRSLIRIVRGPHRVQVDPTGKMPGRGAYLHDRRSCWDRGLKGSLAHALKATLTVEEREQLSSFAATLKSLDDVTEGSFSPEQQIDGS